LEEQTYAHNHEIVIYVNARFGVSFTVPGMHKWLHRHGFVYKKPKGIPHKADKELQKEFIERYEQLKEAAGDAEPIYFMDSVHPTQATKLSYGWIKSGQNKAVGTTASRTRLNIVGALRLGDIGNTLTHRYETVNEESIINFMQLLRENHQGEGCIHLILDRAGYNQSKVVSESAEKLSIKLEFLPPYSPNLNPIERLWKVMNHHARNNRFFKTPQEFRDAISEFFESTLPAIGQSLNSWINDNFQCLENMHSQS
jgi:transposase